MNKQATTLDDLLSDGTNYIKFQLKFSRSIIAKYTRSWKQLKQYAELNVIKSYNKDVEKQILYDLFKDRTKRELSDCEQYFYAGIQKLTKFQMTGKIEVRDRPKYSFTFAVAIRETINQFLEYKRIEDRITPQRLRSHKCNLFQFFSYCNQKKSIHLRTST